MNHRTIWLTGTILAVIVLLAQIAGASTREVGSTATISTELASNTATVSLPAQASSVAQENSAAGLAAANESLSARGQTNTEANEASANAPAAAPLDLSAGARPGWGCGDTNHTHVGPPGRPGATPPPGCAKP
jgi:hypothetical protein